MNKIGTDSLDKKDSNSEQDQNETISSALTGEELLDYIKKHRRKLEDNGDSLCIGAGYGSYTEDGSTICRLDLFSTELINAKKASHSSSTTIKARQQILNAYDFETLQRIVEYGCVSGSAHSHINIPEIEQFFDENEEEITISLEDHFGNEYLEKSAERTGGENSHWKHRAVWRFIEIIANEETMNSP